MGLNSSGRREMATRTYTIQVVVTVDDTDSKLLNDELGEYLRLEAQDGALLLLEQDVGADNEYDVDATLV